jgi:hypothetical protein
VASTDAGPRPGTAARAIRGCTGHDETSDEQGLGAGVRLVVDGGKSRSLRRLAGEAVPGWLAATPRGGNINSARCHLRQRCSAYKDYAPSSVRRRSERCVRGLPAGPLRHASRRRSLHQPPDRTLEVTCQLVLPVVCSLGGGPRGPCEPWRCCRVVGGMLRDGEGGGRPCLWALAWGKSAGWSLATHEALAFATALFDALLSRRPRLASPA